MKSLILNLVRTFTKMLWQVARSKSVLLLLVAVVAVMLHPDLAQAATAAEAKQEVEQTIASMLSIAMQFLNSLLWPFLLIIGDLMDTDLILGPGMEERLKAIWIPIRDLVNIGFVLVLLVVAFYNVLGLGGGEGDLALKTALPKIILGLVIVNFTFVAGKVVFDLTNVATTAVFALPEMASEDETLYDFSATKEDFKIAVCYKTYNEADNSHTSWDVDEVDEDDIPIYTKLFCQTNDEGKYESLDGVLEAKYFTDLNANNIGLVMAVNMGGLSNLELLKEDAIDDFTTLTVSFLFAVIMYLVFAVSYIVLGLVLIARLVVLWIALALSPLAVLVYVVPQIKEWAGGGGDFAQKVIKHLIAPIIIGITMSMGYIMIAAWDGLSGNSALSNTGFQVNEVISKEFLISGINDLPQLIIALASIVIVWKGVFAAASDTYASFATDAIKGFGENVRDFVFKLPMSLPTVPLSVGGEGKEPSVSPMAIKMLLENQMANVTNDVWATEQLKGLEGKTIAGFTIPRGSVQNTNPAYSASEVRRIASEGQIDRTQAADLLRHLYSVVREESSLGDTDKNQLLAEIQRRQQRFENSEDRTVNLSVVREVLSGNINGRTYSFEELGLGSESERRTLEGNLSDRKWRADNAANPQGPNPQGPNPQGPNPQGPNPPNPPNPPAPNPPAGGAGAGP